MVNILDHTAVWTPATDEECVQYGVDAAFDDTILLRETRNWWEGTTAGSYGGDKYLVLLLDGDKVIRARWPFFTEINEPEVAPAIEAILAGP